MVKFSVYLNRHVFVMVFITGPSQAVALVLFVVHGFVAAHCGVISSFVLCEVVLFRLVVSLL